MPIPQGVVVPDFPGAKRFLELYYDGFSMNAMAEDPILIQTTLAGIENPRSRSWAVYHRVKTLISSGAFPERAKGRSGCTLIQKKAEKTVEPRTVGREVAIVVGDVHAPYQDNEAVEVARQVILHVQPDYLFINGDHLDFYQISRFDSQPARKLELQKDLDVGKKILRDFRSAAPNAVMKMREGNHEARLNHWRSRNPEMGTLNCLKLENLLELDKIDCELIPEYQPYQWHDWTITHGNLCRKWAGYTAQGMIDKYGTSGISNHIHRLALVERRNMSRSFVWAENGCLCQLKMEYGELFDWHHGMTILRYEEGEVWAEVVRIKDGRAMFQGHLIKG